MTRRSKAIVLKKLKGVGARVARRAYPKLAAAKERAERAEKERDKLTDLCMAVGFIGQGTQIVGDGYLANLKRECEEAKAACAAWKKAATPFAKTYRHCHFENDNELDHKWCPYGEPKTTHMRLLYELCQRSGQ